MQDNRVHCNMYCLNNLFHSFSGYRAAHAFYVKETGPNPMIWIRIVVF
jgi:hypothetical protein